MSRALLFKEVCSEAHSVVNEIMSGYRQKHVASNEYPFGVCSGHDDVPEDVFLPCLVEVMQKVTDELYQRAVAQHNCTRTIALIVRRAMRGLDMLDTSCDTADLFLDMIIDTAIISFYTAWLAEFRRSTHYNLEAEGVSKVSPPDALWITRLPEITFFIGDLIALGLVPSDITHRLFSYLYRNMCHINHFFMLRRFLERITTPSEIAFIQPLVASIKAKTLKQSKDKIHGLVLKLDVVMLNEKLETERTECIGELKAILHLLEGIWKNRTVRKN